MEVVAEVQQTVPENTYHREAPAGRTDPPCLNGDWLVRTRPAIGTEGINSCSEVNPETCAIAGHPELEYSACWANFENNGLVRCTYQASQFTTEQQLQAFCSKTDETACQQLTTLFCGEHPTASVCPPAPITPAEETIVVPLAPIENNLVETHWWWIVGLIIFILIIAVGMWLYYRNRRKRTIKVEVQPKQ